MLRTWSRIHEQFWKDKFKTFCKQNEIDPKLKDIKSLDQIICNVTQFLKSLYSAVDWTRLKENE